MPRTAGPHTPTTMLELALARRSTRSFTDAPVSDQDLAALLTAAIAGPSAGNRQPWHFYVVRSRELLSRLAIASG